MSANPFITVKMAREKAGMTQSQLGLKMGIDPRQIAQVETLRNGLSIDMAIKAAKVLNEDPDELRTGQLVEQGMAMVEAIMKFSEDEIPALLRTKQGADLFQGAIAALVAIADSPKGEPEGKAMAGKAARAMVGLVKDTLGQAKADEVSSVVKKSADRKEVGARRAMGHDDKPQRDSFGRARREKADMQEAEERDSLGRSRRTASATTHGRSAAPVGTEIREDSMGRQYYRDSLGRARRVEG